MIKNNNILIFFCAVVVCAISFLSYNNNLFGVASDEWFKSHQLESEQLVLDGLLNSHKEGGEVLLGRYSRPGLEDNSSAARELYASGDTSGEFDRYESQYGLQVKVYSKLASLWGDIRFLHAATALLMAVVVSFMFLLVLRDFSFGGAIIFSAVLILSPWMVVFSRNLYWVTALWFIPLAVSMYFSKASFQSKYNFLLMCISLFVAFVLKFLCGYEYLTSVFIASCVPVVYQGLAQGVSYARIAKKLFILGAVLLGAFLFSILMHAHSISGSAGGGIEKILLTASKRISSDDPENTAKKACHENEICEKAMIESLTVNPLKVVGRYFVFADFLPWLGNHEITNAEKDVMKSIYKDPRTVFLYKGYGEFDFLGLLGKSLSVILFLLFLLYVFIVAGRTRLNVLVVLTVSLLAPLSWYVIARGHSYIHTHLNYVLWYLPFVPFGFLLVYESKVSKIERKPNE